MFYHYYYYFILFFAASIYSLFYFIERHFFLLFVFVLYTSSREISCSNSFLSLFIFVSVKWSDSITGIRKIPYHLLYDFEWIELPEEKEIIIIRTMLLNLYDIYSLFNVLSFWVSRFYIRPRLHSYVNIFSLLD